MKKSLTLFFVLVSSIRTVGAQVFLDQLQKKEQGKASVTVTQSKEITDLVNGKVDVAKSTTAAAAPPVTPRIHGNAQTTTAKEKPGKAQGQSTAVRPDKANSEKKEETRHEVTAEKERVSEGEEENESTATTIDTRKKVMRGGYKINGYRVQAFQGGNTRADKQKAQEVCNRIKQRFPEQPVYVHFYAPRWVCRVGNFKTYEEACQMLKDIHAMGYRQAIILRGKITVQN